MTLPPVVDSTYRTDVANEEVPLHEGWLRVTESGRTETARGRVFLSWLPKPVVKFVVVLPGLWTTDRVQVEFAVARRRCRVEAQVTDASIGTGRGIQTQVTGFFIRPASVGAGMRMSSLAFHLPNFVRLEHQLATTAGSWSLSLTPTSADPSATRRARRPLVGPGPPRGTCCLSPSTGRWSCAGHLAAKSPGPSASVRFYYVRFASGQRRMATGSLVPGKLDPVRAWLHGADLEPYRRLDNVPVTFDRSSGNRVHQGSTGGS